MPEPIANPTNRDFASFAAQLQQKSPDSFTAKTPLPNDIKSWLKGKRYTVLLSSNVIGAVCRIGAKVFNPPDGKFRVDYDCLYNLFARDTDGEMVTFAYFMSARPIQDPLRPPTEWKMANKFREIGFDVTLREQAFEMRSTGIKKVMPLMMVEIMAKVIDTLDKTDLYILIDTNPEAGNLAGYMKKYGKMCITATLNYDGESLPASIHSKSVATFDMANEEILKFLYWDSTKV